MGITAPTAAITAILTAIWYEIDHHDGSRVSRHFTEDGSLRFDQRRFVGRKEIDEVYRTRFARGSRVSRHGLSNIHVIENPDGTAHVTSLLFLYAADGVAPIPSTVPAAISDVFDEFVQAGDTWLLRSRAIITTFKEPDTVLAVPHS